MAEQLTTDADVAYDARIAQFEREVAAYDAMWPELLKTHKGEWVAIHQEQLVDEDNDQRAFHEQMGADCCRTALPLPMTGNLSHKVGRFSNSEQPHNAFG